MSEFVKTEPSAELKPRQNRRLLRKLGCYAKVGLPFAVAIVPVGYLKIDTWNTTIDNYTQQEIALLEGKSKGGIKCLNKAIVIGAGVTYSDTPHEVTSRYKGLLRGTEAGTLANDEEMLAKRPIVTELDNGATVYGFSLSPKKVEDGVEIIDDRTISEKTVWVNASRLIKEQAYAEEPLLTYVDLENNRILANEIGCKVKDGEFVASGSGWPTAYSVGVTPAGNVQMVKEALKGDQ